MAEYVSLAEIAAMLGVSHRTAQRYAARDDFPPRKASLERAHRWLRTDVSRWAKRTLPLAEGAPAHSPKTS